MAFFLELFNQRGNFIFPVFRGEHINCLARLTLGQPAVWPRAIWTLTRAKNSMFMCLFSPGTNQQFTYWVVREGVVAEICLNVSAKLPQTFAFFPDTIKEFLFYIQVSAVFCNIFRNKKTWPNRRIFRCCFAPLCEIFRNILVNFCWSVPPCFGKVWSVFARLYSSLVDFCQS